MTDRNRFVRCPTRQKAKCVSKGRSGWIQCTVFNISRTGIGIKFHTSQKIDVGSIIYVEIFPSQESASVFAKGILRWIEKEGDDLVGGVELAQELDEEKWNMLNSRFIICEEEKPCFL